MKTIKQVSKLSGASVRTLQYYDNIKLLTPSRTESSYRLYDDDDIIKLQKILFLKELGFSLKEIRKLINEPNLEKSLAFREQKELLLAKRRHVGHIIQVLEHLENGASFDDCAEEIKKISKESKSMKRTIGPLIISLALLAGIFGLYQVLQHNQKEEDAEISEPDTPQIPVVADILEINPVVMDNSNNCSALRVRQIDEVDLPEELPTIERIALPDDLHSDVQIQAYFSAESTQPINYMVKSSDGRRYVSISLASGRTPIREMYAPEGKTSTLNGHDVMVGSYAGEYYDGIGDLEPIEKYYADFTINGMNYSVEMHGLSESEVVALLKSLL